jgi:serine/threonine protein phosphatase 1
MPMAKVKKENYLAIGDIHGCLDALNEILDYANSYPDHQLIFLGDYIDRGPSVNETLSRLRELENAIFLFGNHELWLFQTMDAIKDKKEKSQYLKRNEISESNFQWLKDNLVFIYETENYIFTHSGLNPNKPLNQQSEEDYVFTYWKNDFKNITSKIVVHGHIHVPEVLFGDNKILVDTGCSLGGHLSGVVLPERIIIKSQQTKNYLRLSVEDIVNNFKKQLKLN